MRNAKKFCIIAFSLLFVYGCTPQLGSALAISNPRDQGIQASGASISDTDAVVIMSTRLVLGALPSGKGMFSLVVHPADLQEGTWRTSGREYFSPCTRNVFISQNLRTDCGSREPAFVAQKLRPGKYAVVALLTSASRTHEHVNANMTYLIEGESDKKIKYKEKPLGALIPGTGILHDTTPVFEIAAGERLYLGSIEISQYGDFLRIKRVSPDTKGLAEIVVALGLPPGQVKTAIMVPYRTAKLNNYVGRDPNNNAWDIVFTPKK